MNGCHRETGTESGLQAIRIYHDPLMVLLGFVWTNCLLFRISWRFGRILPDFLKIFQSSAKVDAKRTSPYIWYASLVFSHFIVGAVSLLGSLDHQIGVKYAIEPSDSQKNH